MKIAYITPTALTPAASTRNIVGYGGKLVDLLTSTRPPTKGAPTNVPKSSIANMSVVPSPRYRLGNAQLPWAVTAGNNTACEMPAKTPGMASHHWLLTGRYANILTTKAARPTKIIGRTPKRCGMRRVLSRVMNAVTE